MTTHTVRIAGFDAESSVTLDAKAVTDLTTTLDLLGPALQSAELRDYAAEIGGTVAEWRRALEIAAAGPNPGRIYNDSDGTHADDGTPEAKA